MDPIGTFQWGHGPHWNLPMGSWTPLEPSNGVMDPIGTFQWGHGPHWNLPMGSWTPLEPSNGVMDPIGTFQWGHGPHWNLPMGFQHRVVGEAQPGGGGEWPGWEEEEVAEEGGEDHGPW